jgi:hypothetical protein
MIQNAIKTQAALQVVQSQAQQFKVQDGKELSYQQYCALLESAAVAYDDTHKDNHAPTAKFTPTISSSTPTIKPTPLTTYQPHTTFIVPA